LVVGPLGIFNADSTLAAKKKGVETRTAGAQDGTSQLNGQLIANGPVTVNGNKAITGATIFTDSNIAVDCAKGNSAVVNLGRLGRVDLVAGTKLTLRFSDGLISGDIQQGKAVISTPPDVKVSVNTPDGGVVTSNCTVVSQTQECITPVAVQGTVQCVPVAAAAPVPVPVSRGFGRWGIIGGVAAAAGIAAAGAASGDENRRVFIASVVSPTTP
jgi:hypothetical protein